MYLKIYNRSRTKVVNEIEIYESLRFESDRIGGFTTCEFEVKRDVLRKQSDLQVYNQVDVCEGARTPWEGYVYEPAKTSPVGLMVPCSGWSGLWTEVPIEAEQPAQKMSTFILAMLADPDISPFVTEGLIDTSDYDSPPATDGVLPGQYYADSLSDYNKWNDWRYYHGEGRRLYFNPPKTVAKWIVLSEDAPGFQIADSPANFWNRVVYKYTAIDGVHYDSVFDADSIAEFERTVTKIIEIPGITTDVQAAHYATVYLSRGKSMTVMGQLTTSTIYDATTMNPASLWKVRGGDVLKVQDFLFPPTGNVVDEVTTFEIKTVQYVRKPKSITITPKDWDSGLEATWAKLDSRD